jgi:hypothetical protein
MTIKIKELSIKANIVNKSEKESEAKRDTTPREKYVCSMVRDFYENNNNNRRER